jgi:ABC-type Fe3+/spermidine/putrescine transport system ATPase subunit
LIRLFLGIVLWKNKSMLQLIEVSKSFSDKKILQDISFEVNAGEIMVIVGESGSGKTTLLNIISGNIVPDTGALNLNGQAIDLYFNRLIRELPDIKLVPQDYRLKPDYKVWENIDIALTEYTPEYRRQRVKELLILCGIVQIKDKKPKEISGGEKQRTAIARAIAEEPLLLLLDEPFSNLDSLNKTHLRDKLVEIIRKESIACILVTHDLLDALLVADRIMMMQKGKILKISTPESLLEESENEYINNFVQKSIAPVRAFLEKFS